MPKRSMQEVHYGIQTPHDLLKKLLIDAEKISSLPDKNDLFNFVVTAAVLSEWILKYYDDVLSHDLKMVINGCGKDFEAASFLSQCEDWIADRLCLPNLSQGTYKHIFNAIRICWFTANASKHYFWQRDSGIKSIGVNPEIDDFYDWFNTASGEGIFIRYEGENYTIEQVKDILIQFYPNFINYLDSLAKE